MASNQDGTAPQGRSSSFASQVSGFNEFISELSVLRSTHNYLHIKDLDWHKPQYGDWHLSQYRYSRGSERLPVYVNDACCIWLVVLTVDRGGMTPKFYPVHPDWFNDLRRFAGQVTPHRSHQLQAQNSGDGQTVGYLSSMREFPVTIDGQPVNLPVFPEASLYTYFSVEQPPVSGSSYAS